MKTLKKTQAWKWFSKYIKLRDNYTCQTCGRSYTGKMMHAGHFIQAFGHNSVFFDEKNVYHKPISIKPDWNKHWIEVATKLCGVDDGLPAELDGLKLSPSRHRKERLKALGNAIVPQVAIEIMKAIKYAENN